MLQEEKDLPKVNIQIKEIELNPVYNSSMKLKGKILNVLENRNIDFESLDDIVKLEVIKKFISACNRCNLKNNCNPVSPFVKTLEPKIGFIQRNPCKKESVLGVNLHSQSKGGKQFEEYMNLLEVSREDVYISNAVLCRTKDNVASQYKYMSKCSIWNDLIFDIIEIPKVIFTLGPYSLRLFFGMDFPFVLNVFGNIYKTKIKEKEVYIVPIIHPGYTTKISNFHNEVKSILRYVKGRLLC